MLLKSKGESFFTYDMCVCGGGDTNNSYWCWKKGSFILCLPASPCDTYFTWSKHELLIEYSRRTCFGNNIAESKNCRPLPILSIIFTCTQSLIPSSKFKDACPYSEPREGAGLAYACSVSRSADLIPASLFTPNSSLTAGPPGLWTGTRRGMGRARKISGV